MRTHPNTIAAGSTGTLGILLAWLLEQLGLDVPTAVAAAIPVVLIAIVLFIGRRGIAGIARLLWRGDPNL